MRKRIELELRSRQTVPMDCTDSLGALNSLVSMIREGGNHFALFPDAWNMYNAARNEELRQVYWNASAVFPDGICWLALARIQGYRLPQRIPGPSFMRAACQYGIKRAWRHFLYGGAPGVAEKLAFILAEKHPGLKVVGSYSPPFRALTADEETGVKERIESSGAHLLWVALGAPKQEFWMAQHLGRINVPVMLGVGAAFDFHSGSRPWAPLRVRKLGLEWAYRAVTGGRKTFARNVKCVSAVALLLCSAALRRASGRQARERGKRANS